MKVLAAGAHPDDIEFMMAGTVLLLKDAGCQVHLWNLCDGCCGSATLTREQTSAVRLQEAGDSAFLIDAIIHPPLFADLDVFYDRSSLARVAAVVREIQPDILLTQSPQDYMEDHQNTVRLLITAAFSRGMRNFPTDPPRPVYDAPVAIYHALPHGLLDNLRNPIQPHFFVNIRSVLARKRAMLACHRSQKAWLDISQGMDAYLKEMEAMSRKTGSMSGSFEFAEGWRRHSHLGFAEEALHPLAELLKQYIA